MNQAAVQARLHLWLRAERALGLSAVPKPKLAATPVLPPPIADLAETKTALSEIPDAPPLIPAAAPILDGPPLSLPERKAVLAEMDAQEVKVCTRCGLCKGRRNTVFGEGSPEAQIFFIGEGPGETEDETGRPFVGRAGNLLDKMIGAMGLVRQDVFIANIVKCRPPGNRTPAPDEVAACTPYLERQLAIVRPRVIVTLGLPASKYMLQTNTSMGRMRGQWHQWRGIKGMPTYHPAFILRSYTEQNRAAVWSDLKKVMIELGLPAKK
jgi:uracil-DNA glycosylase